MTFGEKIKGLRQKNNLTQEELAKKLYVSRAAVSKWESDRGYPSIDLLKDIASLFSISIDELLSNEEIIDIAKTENKANIKRAKYLIFGLLDVVSILFAFLPLYPHRVGGFVYSVSLAQANGVNAALKVCFIVFLVMLSQIGVVELISYFVNNLSLQKVCRVISVIVECLSILIFAVSNQAYLTSLLFVVFALKIILIFLNATKSIKKKGKCK